MALGPKTQRISTKLSLIIHAIKPTESLQGRLGWAGKSLKFFLIHRYPTGSSLKCTEIRRISERILRDSSKLMGNRRNSLQLIQPHCNSMKSGRAPRAQAIAPPWAQPPQMLQKSPRSSVSVFEHV